MELDDSSLYEEILSIADGEMPKTAARFRCFLIASGVQHEVTAVNYIHTVRDYVDNFADSTSVELSITSDIFTQHIYPQRDSLTVTLVKELAGNRGEDRALWESIDTQTFKGVLSETESEVVVDSNRDEELKTFTIELVDMALAPFRVTSVNSIFRDTSVTDTMRTLMRGEFFDDSSLETIRGVDIVEPDNSQVYKHIIIPPNTRAIDVPIFLQKQYGVYGKGLGCYLQRGLWYIYPLYDYGRFEQTQRTLSIISVPEDRMPGTDRSHRLKGDQLMVLATGKTEHVDLSDAAQLNDGNGVKYLAANRVLDVFSQTVKGSTHIQRDHNIVEYRNCPRKDGINFTVGSVRGPTDNHADESTKLSVNDGGLITLRWNNSAPGLIYPGMQVKYLVRDNGEVRQYRGVVLRAEHLTGSFVEGLLQDVHGSETRLQVMVARGYR